MKTISQLTQKPVAKTLTKHHAFYAFSKRQFAEKANPNFQYMNLGGGLIVPEVYAAKVVALVDEAIDLAKEQVLASHTPKEIIWYELSNHEAQITSELDDTLRAVEIFGFTMSDIKKVWPEYMAYCVKEDLF